MAKDTNVQALKAMPVWGKYLFDAFRNVQKQLGNVSVQSNASLSGVSSAPPPALNSMHVDGGAGIYHVYLTDLNQNLYRGAEYTAYYSQTPDFSSGYHPVHLGPSRDIRVNLGIPGPLYWAAHHGYGPASGASPLIYFGGSQPQPVSASATNAPALRPGQGSGTNFADQPPGGYGAVSWRGTNPPKRG